MKPAPRTSSRPLGIAFALVVLALAVPVASADDVYLTNGRAFEDVVATVEGDQVAVRLPHGLIRLPLTKVKRIVRAETPLADYLERKAKLEARPATSADLAGDWVELAAWARDRQLASSYREAARIAADLDPRAPGLEPLMRDLGLRYDDRADRWVTEDELMQGRGYVRYDGAWVTPGERADAVSRLAEARAREEEARRERDQGRLLAALAGALQAEAEADALREARRHDGFTYGVPIVYYAPGYWVPGPGGGHHDSPGRGHGGEDGGGRGPEGGGPPDGVDRTPVPANRGTFKASDWLPGKLNPRAAPPPGTLTGSTAGSRQ